MAAIGYARVSTADQNAQLQLDALQEAGAGRVFTDDGISGSTSSRPQLNSTPASIISAKATSSPSGSSTGSVAIPNTSSPSSTT